MSEVITSIFGKEFGITEQDLKDKLISVNYCEGQKFDAKNIVLQLDENSKESHLIKPIVSFLNSMGGNGLLVLGISTGGARNNTCQNIVPIKDSIIKNEEQLRALVNGNLSSIPQNQNKPNIKIQKVQLSSGNIFLIEVKRIDDGCVYYSTITEYIYIRNNDESERLSLLESLDFIEKKVIPKVFFYLDQPEDIEVGKKLNMAFRNEGLEPGRYLLTTLHFDCSDKNIKIEVTGGNVTSITHINKGTTASFQIVNAYPPGQSLIYPFVPTLAGKVFIHSKEDFTIGVRVDNYENRGKSIQVLNIENKSGTVSVSEKERRFIPYLSLGGLV